MFPHKPCIHLTEYSTGSTDPSLTLAGGEDLLSPLTLTETERWAARGPRREQIIFLKKQNKREPEMSHSVELKSDYD